MKTSLKRRIGAIAIALSLPLAATPVAFSQTGGGGAHGCFGGPAFFGNDFAALSANLSSTFPKNGRVWQAANNGAVFDKYCELAGGKASVYDDGRVEPSVVTLDDGTSIRLRLTSNSGGYTIDINSPNHSKDYKVHVA